MAAGDARRDLSMGDVDRIREWGRWAISRGFAVFPLRRMGKEPATAHGCHDASGDLASVDLWPAATTSYGIHMIGMVGVDIDAHRGGEQTAAELDLPPTEFVVQTPNGGRHMYYRLGDARPPIARTDALGPGVDVKAGLGHYLVGPGSVISVGTYDLVHIEGSISEWSTVTPMSKRRRTSALCVAPPPVGVALAEGGRHAAMTSYAGVLARLHDLARLQREQADVMLYDRWLRCEQVPTPFPFSEALRALDDFWDRPRSVDESAGAGAVTVSLSDVAPEFVEWAWMHRLPLGKIVILDGDPSVGKSTLATDWAARVSTGTAWPDGSPCVPGDVLILSAEDGLADTIRPRLDAAGGDPSRVHALTGVKEPNTKSERSITMTDVELLGDAVRRHGVRLVIVDVFMAYLPGGIDSHRDQDVRSVLARLAALAEETRCCIVLLRHLNKSPGGNPLYRGGGSIAIVGAARAGYVAAVDPDDDTRRVLACTKSNLAAMPTSLAYRLVDAGNGAARVEWLGVTTATAGTVLAAPPDADNRASRDDAGEWLLAYLDKNEQQAKGGDVIAAAKRDDIAERTLRRAAERVGVSIARRGFGEGTVWSLRPRTGQSLQPLGLTATAATVAATDRPDDARGSCSVCNTTTGTAFYDHLGEHRCPPHNPFSHADQKETP